MDYVFYTGWFVLIALAMYSWVPMFRCYGWRCLSGVPTMWRMHSRSKRARMPGKKRTPFVREVVQYMLAAAVCLYFGGFWSLIGGSFIAMAVARVFLSGRVPIILLLGTSSDSVLRLQRGLISLLRGGMVATLLNVDAANDGKWRYAGYVFRTYDDDEWKDCVGKLAKYAALIVLDTRAETDIVAFESKWMAEEFAEKTLFVMGDDGETPALANVSTDLPWVTQIPALTVGALASEIKTAGITRIASLPRDLSDRLGIGSDPDRE